MAILTILALLMPSVVSRFLILSSIESMFAFLDKSTSNFSVTFIRLLSFTTQIYTQKHNFQIFRKVFFKPPHNPDVLFLVWLVYWCNTAHLFLPLLKLLPYKNDTIVPVMIWYLLFLSLKVCLN